MRRQVQSIKCSEWNGLIYKYCLKRQYLILSKTLNNIEVIKIKTKAKTIFENKDKNGANLLITLGWVIYTVSYLGKVNYSANITQIIDFYGVTKSEAGIAPTLFFFAYGIGQVVNGFLCRKYNIKWMIFCSLFVSAIINFTVAISSDFFIIKWLWMINGFVLSVLWPTLIRLLSEVLPRKDFGKSSIVMGSTVASGTLMIYGLSSIFAQFNKFKLAFYMAAISDFIVAVLWLFVYKKAIKMSTNEKSKDEVVENCVKSSNFTDSQNTIDWHSFFITISIICFCSVCVNLIKDGLTTWVPSILKEEFFIKDSLSILLTVLLPVVAIFGNAFAHRIHKKIPDYITHCFIVFMLMGVFIIDIIVCLRIKQALFTLIGLITVSFFASSLNSLITNIFPMLMSGKINSGLYAGVLNGFCYLGSTISSFGLGYIAENFGWIFVFRSFVIICVLVGFIWLIYYARGRTISQSDHL